MNRAEQLVIVAFAAVLLLVGWGGWSLWRTMERHRATADETLRDHAGYLALNYRSSYQTQTWLTVQTLLGAAAIADAEPDRHTTTALVDAAIRTATAPYTPKWTPLRFVTLRDGQWQATSLADSVDQPLQRALDSRIRDTLPNDATYAATLVIRPGDTTLAFVRPVKEDTARWIGFEIALADFGRDLLVAPPNDTRMFLIQKLDSMGVLKPGDEETLLGVTVTTPDSATVFTFGKAIPGAWQGTTSYWSGMPLRINVAIGPAAVAYLMPGGYPPEPGPRVAAVIALALLLTAGTAWLVWHTLALARMRDEFTASVSHELRTPLANIHLYAETLLLERATDPADRRAALETITRETRRLGDMVENVLASARMARAEERIEIRADDLRQLVGEVIAAFTPLLNARGMRVEVERLGPDIARIDGGAVRRILVNLLDNAIRHGPDGQQLRVVVDHDGDLLLLVVEDEGPGIRGAERERVWLPYARGEGGGTGLGLAVVRYLARLHGGDAVVGDHPTGTRIEVRLNAAGVT